MVRRRRLETPSSDDLTRIEDEFRRETSVRTPLAVPIAQVAAEAAAEAEPTDIEDRAARARDKADAERLRQAEADGLVVAELSVEEIDADAIVRDRISLERTELEELCHSIAASGLRLPIEVYEVERTVDGYRFGLISGYRRLMAVRDLFARTGQEKYRRIRALVRPATTAHDTFAAMVEENEIRSNLSHFERGRVAVVAVRHRAFRDVEEAVDALFASASRAKRSKVRSFAQIFEDLGDVLTFPEALTEKRGLRLANALRAGAKKRLHDRLEAGQAETPDLEWNLMVPVVDEVLAGPRNGRRGGRPRSKPEQPERLTTSGGITVRHEADAQGHLIRLEGPGVDAAVVEALMARIRAFLDEP